MPGLAEGAGLSEFALLDETDIVEIAVSGLMVSLLWQPFLCDRVPACRCGQGVEVFGRAVIVGTARLPAVRGQLCIPAIGAAFRDSGPLACPYIGVVIPCLVPPRPHFGRRAMAIDIRMVLPQGIRVQSANDVDAFAADRLSATTRTALHMTAAGVSLPNCDAAVRARWHAALLSVDAFDLVCCYGDTSTTSPNGTDRPRVGVSQIVGHPGSCGVSLLFRSVA